MDRTALHLEVRNALELSDELSRYEHAIGDDELTGHLAALRTTLDAIERVVGRSHVVANAPDGGAVRSLRRSTEVLVLRRDDFPVALRRRLGLLVASADRVTFGLEHPLELARSKPLFGALPVARIVPQDVHSVLDYLGAAANVAAVVLARSSTARLAGAILGALGAGVSLCTDYRLSALRIIPIEVHEAIDYAWGASVAAAPFVLGYAKKDPLLTSIQIGVGLGTIAASLVTDYRAALGATWPVRSRGGPEAGRIRVPEAQRPLEGLSSAASEWDRNVHP